MSKTKYILEAENISKSFKQGTQKLKILEGASLRLREGEIVALIGPSGSGKSTFLQISGLLDSPTSGKIVINNIDYTNATDAMRTKARLNHLGFIYQSHHLLSEFSAVENVALPLIINGKSRVDAIAEAKILLNNLGLEVRLNHFPAQLSGGEQQRVAIARALINNPKLILADEPTGNLDHNTAEQVFSILLDYTKKTKKTCLIVTHNLDLAKRLDRIFSLKAGKIIDVTEGYQD